MDFSSTRRGGQQLLPDDQDNNNNNNTVGIRGGVLMVGEDASFFGD